MNLIEIETAIAFVQSDEFIPVAQMPSPVFQFDTDLFAAFNLSMQGIDLLTPVSVDMPADIFNALSFAQANDIGQFHGSAEYNAAAIASQAAEFYIDLFMAFYLSLHGVDMSTPLAAEMPDSVYNAMAFAQSNDITQFYGTAEFDAAIAAVYTDCIIAPITTDWIFA